MWPQIVMIVFMVMAVTIALVKNGERRQNPNYSFGTTFVGLLIECGILYAGGFFDVLNK